MEIKEAIKRIEEHKQIHFAKKYPRAIKITEALDMAIEKLNLLAEYEDTGLTPQEIEQMKARMPLHQWAGESPEKMSIFGISVKKIMELVEAEKQDRLLVLPCKEGTTIYQTCYKCICTLGHTYLHNTCHSPIECRKCKSVKIERWIRETTFSLSMLDRIGADFFINREDAEATLKDI